MALLNLDHLLLRLALKNQKNDSYVYYWVKLHPKSFFA